MKCLSTTLLFIFLFIAVESIGQSTDPSDNKFRISVGELEKYLPDEGYGGASRKMFFKDTTFILDYMNSYSISYDGLLAAIKWYDTEGGNIICTYDTSGIEISQCSNVAKNPRSIVLFNNGYFAVLGGDRYEFPNEKYFYVFDNEGIIYYHKKNFKKLDSLNYKYDSNTIQKVNKHSKNLRH